MIPDGTDAWRSFSMMGALYRMVYQQTENGRVAGFMRRDVFLSAGNVFFMDTYCEKRWQMHQMMRFCGRFSSILLVCPFYTFSGYGYHAIARHDFACR